MQDLLSDPSFIPALLGVMGGNWSSVYNNRERLRSLLQEPDIEEQVQQLYDQLFNSPAGLRIVERGDPSVNAEEILVPWLSEMAHRLSDQAARDGDPSEWGAAFRRVVVRYIGGACHFVRGWLGEESIGELLTGMAESNIQLSAFPFPVASILQSFAGSRMQQWVLEYNNELSEVDDLVLRVPGRQQPDEVAPGDDSLEDLVDSLLDDSLDRTPYASNDPSSVVQAWGSDASSPSAVEEVHGVLQAETQGAQPAAENSLFQQFLNAS